MARLNKPSLENPHFLFEKKGADIRAELQELDDIDSQRVGRQLENIIKARPTVNTFAQATDRAIDSEALGQAFRKFDRKDKGQDQERRVCLFNLIVALEWQPSPAYIQTLKEAFTQASGLLFDVTDGFMAIGNVTIGGSELMDCADIQIFASNRLSPRSSVDGMNNPEKYQPIRLGRSLWHKVNRKNPSERATFPWSHPKGYATIVHELGHYALGLKDQYLNFDPTLQVVIPEQQLTKDTIMARLDSSELLDDAQIANQESVSELVKYGKLRLLAPRANATDEDKTSEWEALRQHPRFKWLNIDTHHTTEQTPPPEKVSPAFQVIGTAADPFPGQELSFSLNGASAGGQAIDSDCWVYVMKGVVTGPTGLIAQGSLETPGPFSLLGAQVGDSVVLIGKRQGISIQPLVLWAQIVDQTDNIAKMGVWQDGTPNQIPIIDVAAFGDDGKGAAPPYRLKLTGFSSQSWKAITFPLGEKESHVGTKIAGLTVLDGHVLLVSTDTDQPQLAIANYSLGGSAFSGYPAHPNPIPAGSADGNAMLFFFDASQKLEFPIPPAPSGRQFDASKVVVTTNLQDSAPLPAGCVPRSYVFSVTSNTTFYDLQDLHPTLTLYYDAESRVEAAGTMFIARYAQAPTPGWILLANTIDHQDDYFAAVALTDDRTEPGLFKNPPQPDHFRLFLRTRADTSQQ